MILFETNPDVFFKNVDTTFLFIFIGLPALVSGMFCGCLIFYFIYKGLKQILLFGWCKTFAPAAPIATIIMVIRLTKDIILLSKKLVKMI